MSRRPRPEYRIFTVEGSGGFPFDMLRFDSCWPYSEGHDSPKLAAKWTRRIVLQTASENAPTTARWESFNWKVVDATGATRGGPRGVAGLTSEQHS